MRLDGLFFPFVRILTSLVTILTPPGVKMQLQVYFPGRFVKVLGQKPFLADRWRPQEHLSLVRNQ